MDLVVAEAVDLALLDALAVDLAAVELDAGYDVLEKRRLSADKIEIKPRSLKVKGKDVVLIDDIISTGGTLAEAIRVLKNEGARTVIAACAHPVLVENAFTRIYEAGADSLVSTDTIPSPVSLVSVAGLIARALERSQAQQSLRRYSDGDPNKG